MECAAKWSLLWVIAPDEGLLEGIVLRLFNRILIRFEHNLYKTTYWDILRNKTGKILFDAGQWIHGERVCLNVFTNY